MAREALFNLLRTRADLESATIIDLFAGTGFVSFEFCSRGAASVTAIEQHQGCILFMRKASETLGLESFRVLRNDVFRFLKHPGLAADIVFADPPYELPHLDSLPDLIIQSDALKPGGMLILEHGPTHSFTTHSAFSEERNYGKVHFTFFAKAD
jgi:16S rRNA (guanine966-N2)-methyltransferase